MNVARELLEKGTSISEAARACGYNSPGNFTATYTKYFGEKPIKKKTILKYLRKKAVLRASEGRLFEIKSRRKK